MNVRYDEKGKFFTDIITKDPVPSTIQTLVTQIKGNVHVRLNERVKDELNRGEQFLAVTDAEIFNLQGQKISEAQFILINRDHVIWIIPSEESTHREDHSEGEA